MILDEILRQVLVFLFNLTGYYGFSIIALSLVVFIIMLPLFWLTEKLQNKERIRRFAMQGSLNDIEDVNNRQEKYYYTKEIYKKYDYKAYYSLTGLIGLLIQIPFFLAAYWMLSDFEAFDGRAFGPISNLHQPDALLSYELYKINLLPFLMTIVNLIGIYFVRDRLDSKEIKQLVGTSIIFLVILYNSSSALVLYWTANNFFSIFKNKLIRNELKRSNANSFGREWSLVLLNEKFNTFEKGIFNLLSILIGYFFFVHIMLTFSRGGQTLSSKVFLTLTYLTLIIVLSLNSFLRKRINKLVPFIFTLMTLVALCFLTATFRNLIGISIDTALIINQTLVLIGCSFLIWKWNRIRNENSEGIIFFMPSSQYFLFFSLLIPLTVYLQSNLEYFSIASGLIYYILLVGIPILVFQLFWLLFQTSINQKLYSASFVAAILTFYLVPIITDYLHVNSASNFIPHLLLLLFLILVFVYLQKLDKKILPFLTVSVLTIVVFLRVNKNEINNTVEKRISAESEMVNASEIFFSDKKIRRKPNIYLLIYDAYVEESQMDRLYNIDNSIQMEFLKAQKFEIHNNVYSTGRATLSSMSNVVNLSNIFDSDIEYRKRINGESVINRILQNNGYVTKNILNPHMTRSTEQLVDFSYPSNDIGMLTIVKAICVGEFKFNIEYSGYDAWIDKKNEILQNKSVKPVFLYAHSMYPGHSQNSGTLLPNENQLYEERLKIANVEMKNDLSQILKDDKESIIIIAGDHGPYLTGDGSKMLEYEEEDITSNNILDRYGVFTAIKYPDNWKKSYGNKIEVLQEVFVNVLAKMYEVEAPANLIGKESRNFNDQIPIPALNNGIIQIGKNKGERLYNYPL